MLLFTAVVIWLAFALFSGGKRTGIDPKEAPLVVSASKEGAYRTVSDAVAMARPGQQVVIEDEVVTEQLLLDNRGSSKRGHGVTITAAPGRNVTWKPPANLAAGDWFIKLANVPGLQLKHITFDGEGKLNDMMLLTGTNPDLLIEDVTFQGFKGIAVKIANAAGADDHLITFRNTTITSGAVKAKHALAFSVHATTQPPQNRFFNFRELHIEGDFVKPIEVLNEEVRAALVRGTWKNRAGVLVRIDQLPKPAPPPPPPPPPPKATKKG